MCRSTMFELHLASRVCNGYWFWVTNRWCYVIIFGYDGVPFSPGLVLICEHSESWRHWERRHWRKDCQSWTTVDGFLGARTEKYVVAFLYFFTPTHSLTFFLLSETLALRRMQDFPTIFTKAVLKTWKKGADESQEYASRVSTLSDSKLLSV